MVRAAPLHVPRPTLLVLVAALLLLLPGCIVRRLKIVRPGVSSSAKLQTASLQQLVEQLRVWDEQIRTVNATVDMEPSLGSVLKGEISELKEVRGFVLIRKPKMIRMIGLYPVVRNRAFDMVSDGDQFKLYVPAKDKFIVGNNHQKKPSDRRLENLRPQHIFEALVVRPPNDGERLVLENDTDELHANYILHVLKEQNGLLLLARNVWFDRVHLRVVRQQIFDDQGDMISDTRYDDYQEVEGIPFPKRFLIMRPKDEYGIKLKVKKVKLNAPAGGRKICTGAAVRQQAAGYFLAGPQRFHQPIRQPIRQPISQPVWRQRRVADVSGGTRWSIKWFCRTCATGRCVPCSACWRWQSRWC